jgi:hypothetical protein
MNLQVAQNAENVVCLLPVRAKEISAHSVYPRSVMNIIYGKYRGADKSLARPGRKQAATVKIVMGRGMDWFG